MKTIRNIVIIMLMMSIGLKITGGEQDTLPGLNMRRLMALALVAIIHLVPLLAIVLAPTMTANLLDERDGRGRAGAQPLMLVRVTQAPVQPVSEIRPVQISSPPPPTPLTAPVLVMPSIPTAQAAPATMQQPSRAAAASTADAIPVPAIEGLSGSQQRRDQHEQSSADDKGGGGMVADAYLAELLEWINRQKRYPADAAARRITGDVVLALVVDRWGRIRTLSLHRSSGERILDLAALAQVKRASPLPRPDDPDWETRRFEITIRFELADLER